MRPDQKWAGRMQHSEGKAQFINRGMQPTDEFILAIRQNGDYVNRHALDFLLESHLAAG